MAQVSAYGLAPVWWTVSDLASAYVEVTISSCLGAIRLFGPYRAFFRPGPHEGAAGARSGGQGRPFLRPPVGLVLDHREHAGRLAGVGRSSETALVLGRAEIADRGVA